MLEGKKKILIPKTKKYFDSGDYFISKEINLPHPAILSRRNINNDNNNDNSKNGVLKKEKNKRMEGVENKYNNLKKKKKMNIQRKNSKISKQYFDSATYILNGQHNYLPHPAIIKKY
eukprot:TRINITY_DN503_c1_g1_i1.p1 TRINITY_DN503_c1_g1~~TRINITY_DN503_c1_g1_i1.p1  ORF type:complete len:117 (-),score=21.17 TRINITY_DN503_c1_g1_i1:141-491(-)